MRSAEDRTIDWSQLWYPGPARRFSADEMARAGQQPWRRMIDHYVLGNLLVMLTVSYPLLQKGLAPYLFAGTLLLAALALQVARRLWLRPTRRALNFWSLTAGLAFTLILWGGMALFGRHTMDAVVIVLTGLMFFCISGWWFLVIFRVQQIEARLRELADRAGHLAMQGQLLQAQIQPHFLFNSLASLTHWVRSQDRRAAPLLEALTGYLRATLPLFNRQQLSLGEELTAVRQYLAVMQARLGDRLQVQIEVPAALLAAPLPPAILLTLVENAIEHGVMPKLGSAQLRIAASMQDQTLQISVSDDGPGLPESPVSPPSPAAGRGVGLANSRLRLSQAYGTRASLQLSNAAEGGCVATLCLPLPPPLSASIPDDLPPTHA